MKVFKNIIKIIPLFLWTIGLIKVNAAEIKFDPEYYRAKYNDVAEAFGENDQLLYQHYITFGILEGRYPNEEDELNNITHTIEDIKSTVIPLYPTYVDVNITTQTVTYFQDGTPIIQSPCVTGNVKHHRDTPVGSYKILTKTKGKYLVGPTWKNWVNYWMRFTPDSIGLHDATWRKEFGGEIYKTNGSHGCVNLTKEFAADLFNLVQVGTIVEVHQ